MLRSLVVLSVLLAMAGRADAFCLFNCSYTRTQYPIVLAHGLLGFEELLGVVEYWNGIPSALRDGGARVYVTQVSPINSSESRGEQLLDQVLTIRAITGAAKVNLIGHSQGGLDARYVAAVRPDVVASVTTVGSPHKGADLADLFVSSFEGGALPQGPIEDLFNSVGLLIQLLSGYSAQQDAVAALETLSSGGTASFNAQFPGGVPTTACGSGASSANGVRFWSWSGTGVLTNALDIGDPLLGLTSVVYDQANDGLVDRCSSHFGVVLRDDYFYNHLDEVNQVLGLTSLFESDPRSVFRAHANRLKNAGL